LVVVRVSSVFFANVVCVFFFQAEDGIRDRNVTGVQTCALPISTIQGKAPGLRIMFDVPEGVDLGYFKLNWRHESDPDGSKYRETQATARYHKEQAEETNDEELKQDRKSVV